MRLIFKMMFNELIKNKTRFQILGGQISKELWIYFKFVVGEIYFVVRISILTRKVSLRFYDTVEI
jgi:hypothetical protein